ncbi:MAG TPA: ester cyclase [Polyangia bacterium]|jgi:predicted ester cyclase|nr:ester cyclase [Polyangia bacterium]
MTRTLVNKKNLIAASLLPLTAVLLSTRPALAEKPLEGQALADRYTTCWDLFGNKKWAEFETCYDASTVSVAPGQQPAKGGKAIVEKHAKTIAEAMPDVKGDVQLMLVSGRKAVTVAVFTGTHTGPLKGPMGTIPATNKKIGQVVAHAIESGPKAIASKEWFIQDGGTMMAQLGLSPMPARPALDKGWMDKPTVVIAGNSKTEQENLAALKKGYAGFNKHDGSMFAMFADDIVDHDYAAPADRQGKPAVVGFLEGVQKMSSNVKVKPTSVFAAGDYTVAIGELAGTNDGDMPAMGIAKKTGKSFKMNFIEIARWEGGKLKEIWPFVNGMQMGEQLGLMPPPAKTAQK